MSAKVELAGARPQARTLDLEHTALIVIDMQRDFLEPGGYGSALGNDVTLLAGAIPQVRRLLAAFRSCGLPVLHTVEGHRSDLSDCPPVKRFHGQPGLRVGDPGPFGRYLILGEPGNAPIPACRPWHNEFLLEKPGKGAFTNTHLEQTLRSRGLNTLILCGVTAEVCVQSTAREAADRGFEVILASDATASYLPDFHKVVIEMIVSQGGIVGWAATTNQILFSLLSSGVWKARVTWTQLRPGLEKASLGIDSDGWEAAFLRYSPGAAAPKHRHQGTERYVMLSGSQHDDRGEYGPGSSVENPPGSIHDLKSHHGCELFIDWDLPVEFLTASKEPL